MWQNSCALNTNNDSPTSVNPTPDLEHVLTTALSLRGIAHTLAAKLNAAKDINC